MQKTAKRIWNILTWTIVLAVMVLAILLGGTRIFGIKPYVVLSGSMEPVYHTGSLIYVKDIEDTRNIPDGTVITYMVSDDTIVTHRVVTAVPDEEDPSVVRYRTKGDANDIEDGTMVHYKNIIGTPVFSIPKLGYVANFIQNPPGTYITISLGAIFVLLLFLPELWATIFPKEEDAEPAPKKEKPAKEPKPKKEKAPKVKKEKPVKEPKPKKEKRKKPEKAAPAVEETQPILEKAAPVAEPAPVVEEAPVVEPEPVIVEAPAEVEEPRTPRGRHELKSEKTRRPVLAPKPQKKKGGAHVIKK
ncbi:MAG: signal peptidase I [Oscillospiraceae bacterium]|nr:signal peptidase I [Oscillospiraceae bacterium]